ncbi:uncharacterized protein LOC143862337 [Tasmannia lanceolata]|uniref:uncharacterized protein LOC143862337 n=1 Tax=Tasmannia lanceolata TaxID=3420 RepID=UPI004062AAAA
MNWQHLCFNHISFFGYSAPLYSPTTKSLAFLVFFLLSFSFGLSKYSSMGRQPCCEKIGLKRGPWTMDEDEKLINFILKNGIHCWRLVPKLAGLMRCGKSCRLRWTNYLRPDLKRGALSEMEEDQIIQLHSQLGNRWSKIAAHLPGRTDNEIKNQWNTRIKKRLKILGLDPVTHTPIEQPENYKEKGGHVSKVSPWEEQEKNKSKVVLLDNPGQEELPLEEVELRQEGYELDLHGYGMLWKSKDEEMKLPSYPSDSYNTSFSLEDNLFSFMGEESFLLEDSTILGWKC